MCRFFALSDTVCIFGEGKRKKSHVTVLAFLEAQVYAVDFYRKEGFEVTSGEFLEDGIAPVHDEIEGFVFFSHRLTWN